MKVMTFNIRSDNWLDIQNRWRDRADLVYETIRNYQCDIIGLQEVTRQMHRDLEKNITDYTIVGLGRTENFFHEKNNILISNQYKTKENETFWLSKTPHKRGSSIWYSLFPRICTTAVIQLTNGQKIRVYNTHLDCLLPHAREYGLRKIGQAIEKHHNQEKLPCILMGDFNATPHSKLIKKFSDGIYSSKKFIAVQDTNQKIYQHTTMGMFKGRHTGMHIDYIFVTEEFTIKDVQIIKYNQNGKYPSDHYPIVADIQL